MGFLGADFDGYPARRLTPGQRLILHVIGVKESNFEAMALTRLPAQPQRIHTVTLATYGTRYAGRIRVFDAVAL